jgi:hypothetical protein
MRKILVGGDYLENMGLRGKLLLELTWCMDMNWNCVAECRTLE